MSDGAQREMTLNEYVRTLPSFHRAVKELDKLQEGSQEAVEAGLLYGFEAGAYSSYSTHEEMLADAHVCVKDYAEKQK